MNARLIKETRDLLPILAGTLVLIAVPYLIWRGNTEGLGYVAFGLACVVLGGSSFGNEFQHRTITLLLSQPIARSVLWREKMLILGGGMLAGIVVLGVCLQVSGSVTAGWPALVLVPLCAFCGAPYWTLSLRHGLGGMAFAAAFPASLLGASALVMERLFVSRAVELGSGLTLLVIYCALVYWRGYARFKRLEAVDGPARELSLPASLEACFVRPLTKLSSRFRGPFATLLKKEFRLQQISFLLAGLFVLLAVAGACLLKHHRGLGEGILAADGFIYVLILPAIVGATSVAEEKGWGIAEWHLTLPPSALKQWSAKMLAAFSTSLALGLLLPAAMFLAGRALFDQSGARGSLPTALEPLCWSLGSLLLTSVAVYAASISHSTLRAILAAVGLIVASLVASTLTERWAYEVLSRRALGPTPSYELVPPVLCAGVFLLLCLTQRFAWSNFQRSGLPVRRFAVQLLVIFLALGLMVLAISAAPFLYRIFNPRLIY